MSNNRKIVVLSGPSGVGKTTVSGLTIAAAAGAGIKLRRSVSATTRAPRRGEKDGIDYTFISPDRFSRWAREGRFVEYAVINGRSYGTLKSMLEKSLDRGEVPLLTIDPQGAMQVKRSRMKVLSIFLLPPDRVELRKRLMKRRTESKEEIALRLETAKAEMGFRKHYDYRVVNKDLPGTVRRILRIFRKEKIGG